MMKKKAESKKIKEQEATFLDLGDELVELIGEKGEVGSQMFLRFNVISEEIKPSEGIIRGNVKLTPPDNDLVANGTVLLPTYPLEYESTVELLKQIQDFVHRFVDIPPTFERIVSYYVLLTWVYDCFGVLPYLRVLGDYGTGKTRFQKTVGSICYKPMFCGGATTPSPIFRIIDLYRGTLIIDEADFRFSDAPTEIIKIFNCGYQKGIPVLRTEGETKRVPTSYRVYGPKLISSRKKFVDEALESRCITEVMEGEPRDDIPLHLPKGFEEEALELRNKLLLFRFRNYGKIEVDLELALNGIESRLNEVLLPLMSIVSDEDVLSQIGEFARAYSTQLKAERGGELPAEVLQVMVKMVGEGRTLQHRAIAEELNIDRDEKKRGEKPISPARVGRINSSDLHFKTRRMAEGTEIIWDEERAERLGRKYGVEVVKEKGDERGE